eukprot:g3790.t1
MIPAQLSAAQAELDGLGGGDTRICNTEVVCRLVGPGQAPGAPAGSVSTDGECIVSVRDPRQRSADPKRYKMTQVVHSGGDHANGDFEDQELHDSLGSRLADWIWSGFNASLISHGQAGTGKTHCLFGGGSLELHTRAQPQAGLCEWLLGSIFERIAAAAGDDAAAAGGGERYSVGISCWDVLGAEVVDLLDPAAAAARSSPPSLSFLTCSASSLASANEILAAARCRSANWTSDAGPSGPSPLRGRAHSFVRVVLHDARAQLVSTVHLVDLVGARGRVDEVAREQLEAAAAAAGPEGLLAAETAGVPEAERRHCSQQLLAFSRLVQQVVRSQRVPGSGGRLPAAARDSVLTQILGPMLVGNAKTYMLCSVRAGAGHAGAAEALEAMEALKTAECAGAMRSACMRLRNIERGALKLLPASAARGTPTDAGTRADPPPLSPSRAVMHQMLKSVAQTPNDSASLDQLLREAQVPLTSRGGAGVADAGVADAGTQECQSYLKDFRRRRDALLADDDGGAGGAGVADVADVADEDVHIGAGAEFLRGAVAVAGVGDGGGDFDDAASADYESADGESADVAGANIARLKREIQSVMNDILHPSSDPSQQAGEQRGGDGSGSGGGAGDDGRWRYGTARNPVLSGGWGLDEEAVLMVEGVAAAEDEDGDGDAAGPVSGADAGDNSGTEAPQLAARASAGDWVDVASPAAAHARIAAAAAASAQPVHHPLSPTRTAPASVSVPASRGSDAPEPTDPAALALPAAPAPDAQAEAETEAEIDAAMASIAPLSEADKAAALLRMLREEQRLKAVQLRQRAEVEHELLERTTTYEVALDGLKLENIELRSRLRKMAGGCEQHEVFEQCERDVGRLEQELHDCRARNAALELELSSRGSVDAGDEPPSAEHARGGARGVGGGRVARAASKGGRRARAMQEELGALRTEVATLRKERRKWLVHKRVAERAGRQLHEASSRLAKSERELVESRLRRAQVEARAEGTEARNVELAASEAALMEDRERASQEVRGMRMYVQEVEKERRKNEVIERFVRKHETGTAPGAFSASARRAHAQAHRGVRNVMRPMRETADQLISQLRAASHPELLGAASRLRAQLREAEALVGQQAEREGDLMDALVSLQSSMAITNEFDATKAFQTQPFSATSRSTRPRFDGTH